jgi:hypothetical protein
MDSGHNRDYLPSRRIAVLAGLIVFGFVVYLLSGSGIMQAITADSDDQNSTPTSSIGRTDSPFLANQEPPESMATITEAENITDRTTNSVAPRALALAAAQENGEDISEEDIARVAGSMSENIKLSEPETFQRSDFNQYNTANQANIRTYGESVTKIIYDQAQQGPSTAPPKVLANHLRGSGGELEKLNRHIDLNASIVDRLEDMTVPARYLPSHIRLIEGFALAENSLKKIKQIDTDPTVAVIGIRQYREATDEVINTADKLANQLSNDINQ